MPTPATLIYNRNAGRTKRIDIDELQHHLSAAGFAPVYHATSTEKELDPILADAEGLVVVVGGDGTVRAVATRLVDKGVPLAIVPLGTANNVARTLGVQGTVETLLEGLAEPRRVPFDVGRVRHPWGADYFLEAVGCGIFADILYRYDPAQGKSVLRALNTLRDVLVGYEPKELQVRLDGEDLSERYLGLEVLNTKATGPRLQLAPNADPTDGLLDVVRILPPGDEALLPYVGRLVTEAFDELPNVEVRRGRRLEISWNGDPIHVDAELRPAREEGDEGDGIAPGVRPSSVRGTRDRIEVEIVAGALEVWLPSDASTTSKAGENDAGKGDGA